MPTSPAPPLSEADYDAIEAAVVETMRGRWFLAEYARRNRHADTTMLITALDRIETAMRGEGSVQSADRMRFDLVEMAKAIARTKAEIAAIKPDADHHGKFGEATDELDAIVQATEHATSEILSAAEQIQEIAWTLREQGLEAEVCDLLDVKATNVYTACSFQDLTGQRTRKVIGVMRYLEGRINAMINIWRLDGAMAAEAAETERARGEEAGLLNGPARPGQGLDQSDVDMVMGPAEPTLMATAPPGQPAERPPASPPPLPYEPVGEPEPAAPPLQPVAQAAVAPPARSVATAPPAPNAAPAAKPAVAAGDPLAAVTALSYEEKIALFT